MNNQHARKNNYQVLPEFTGWKRERYEQLRSLRAQLERQIRSLSQESLVDRHEAGEDLADVGSDNFLRDTELAIMTGEEKTLTLVREAIQRLIDDSYGECIDCGDKINELRLDAIPYAKLCIDCKEARENNEEMYLTDEANNEVTE
jgi:DnaK suppressor protein